jgi:hypothetical protein
MVEGEEVEWCASSASTMPGLGAMVQRSLGDRRALMDSRRAGALSGAIVASMVGLVRGFASVYHPGDRFVKIGGGEFWRMHTGRYLSIVPWSQRSW